MNNIQEIINEYNKDIKRIYKVRLRYNKDLIKFCNEYIKDNK